jgi:hypothetical protein
VYLELDLLEATRHGEGVTLAHGAIGFGKIGLKVGLENVARDAFNGVLVWQDVNGFAVLDLRERGTTTQTHNMKKHENMKTWSYMKRREHGRGGGTHLARTV